MNIFITGATGYIGNNLAKRLADEGYTIHALNRSSDKAPLLEHTNIKIFSGDINDPDSIKRAMQDCEQVYHLAAYARVWAKNPADFYKFNVTGTKNVLDEARKLNVGKIIFTSTAGVLGPSKDRPVKEDDKRIGTVFNEYEETKTQAEDLCREYCNKYGMNIVMVNPPRVYGPGIMSESNPVTKMILLYTRRKWKILPGDGSKTGSYVYIDDVVNGHILAMEKGRSGERYILSGVNMSYNEFFQILAEISGVKQRLFHLPVWAMFVAGYGMLALTKLTGKPPLLTPKWIKKYLYDWSLNCEKAQRELGYTYVSLEEGLRKTVNWINSNNKVL